MFIYLYVYMYTCEFNIYVKIYVTPTMFRHNYRLININSLNSH